MATNCRVKNGKNRPTHLHSFIALAFLNRVEYRNCDFNRFICDDLATLCENLVNLFQ